MMKSKSIKVIEFKGVDEIEQPYVTWVTNTGAHKSLSFCIVLCETTTGHAKHTTKMKVNSSKLEQALYFDDLGEAIECYNSIKLESYSYEEGKI